MHEECVLSSDPNAHCNIHQGHAKQPIRLSMDRASEGNVITSDGVKKRMDSPMTIPRIPCGDRGNIEVI
jgi:hypothetical protein